MDSKHADSARAIVDRATELGSADLARLLQHGVTHVRRPTLVWIAQLAIDAACDRSEAPPAAKKRARVLWAAEHGLSAEPESGDDTLVEHDDSPDMPNTAGHKEPHEGPRSLRLQVMVTEEDMARLEAWSTERGVSKSTGALLAMRERWREDGF